MGGWKLVGWTVGDGVVPTIVGAGLRVGCPVGEALGTSVGLAEGAALGVVVGAEVAPARQTLLPVLTHRGENESNCCRFSNTDANSHKSPVLFVAKFSLLLKELPKTATFETPTALFLKHVFSIVKGPRVSMIKLFVVDCRSKTKTLCEFSRDTGVFPELVERLLDIPGCCCGPCRCRRILCLLVLLHFVARWRR